MFWIREVFLDVRSFLVLFLYLVLCLCYVVYSFDGLDMWPVWGQERCMHVNLKAEDHFKDLAIEGIMILNRS